ncbi:hypothetical protein [Saccharopolyspora sp. NPDC002376]
MLARHSGDQAARLRAEALALFASNRLGRGVPATGRALAAVRDAEAAGDAEVTAELRVELAWCACAAGSSEVAARILFPVLEQERIEPSLRAHALLASAASMPVHQQDGARTEVLDEAERLCGVGESNRDTARLLKARVCAARAGHHRRIGKFAEATTVADAGLELLGRLGDPAADSGEIRTWLVLERVQSLLELGHRPEAVQAAERVLAEPVRAAAAGPVGWLGLALATRVHLPNGDHAAALRVLSDTAAISERHKLDGLLAESLNTLSQVHEQGAEIAEALRAVRGAYAADRRWRAAVHHARMRLLAEYPELTEDVEVSRQSRGSHSAVIEPGLDVFPPVPQIGYEEPEIQFPEADPVDEQLLDAEPSEVPPVETQFPESDEALGAEVQAAEVGPTESEPVADSLLDAVAPEMPRPRSDSDDAADVARRLMDSLTIRAVELREERRHRQEASESRTSDEPTVVLDSALLDDLKTSARQPAEEHPPVTADVTDQAFSDQEPAEESLGQSDWWPSEGWDQPAGGEATIPGVRFVPETLLERQDEAEPESDSAFALDPSEAAAILDAWPSLSADRPAADATAILPVIEPEPTPEPAPELTDDRQPAAPAVSRHGAPEPVATEARDEDHQRSEAVPSQPTDDADQGRSETGGRRSRGRSLAEIRASLQLSERPRGGRRRARHAEPEEPAPLAAVVARHRQPDQTAEDPQPELPAESQPPPQEEGPSQETWPNLQVVEPPPEPAADPGPAEKVGLAELLTEALLAYETGRRGQEEAETARAGRHSEARVSGITERSQLAQTAFASTSDDCGTGAVARHRRPGIDAAARDPLL